MKESLGILSDKLKGSILNGFEEYGLTIPEFYVTNVLLPENDPNFKRIKDLHTIALQKKMVEAEAEVKAKMAEAEASVTVAERQAVLERETTATEMARREAERDIIRAQVEAEKAKLAGFAEAEVMRAKGYNEKDVIEAEVKKAYAEGIGNMNISGGGGSVAGDMLGLGVGMAAAGAVSGQMGEMFKGMTSPLGGSSAPAEEVKAKAKCPSCGAEVPENAKFCLECGNKIEILAENEMICPSCGAKTAKGKFCSECGASLVKKCPSCGVEVTPGAKFCVECGEKL